MIEENPYYHRGPIKETKHFYGRARETARALQMVRNGQSVSVIGPRRIGKTSLLFHLSDPTVRVENGLHPEQSLLVYIDGGMMGGLSRSDILRAMLEEAADQTGQERGDIPPVVEQRSFEQAVRKWVRPGGQLVYLFDEFDCFGNNRNLDADFFSFLRSLTVRYNVVYVTASQAPLLALIDEGGKLSSPFFNIFVPIQLGLFREENARQLIREPSQAAGIEFSRGTEGFILDLVGPHPFFLQIACYHAFELQREDPAFGEGAQGLLEQYVQTDLESHFKHFTDRLSDTERRILVCLADTGQMGNSTAVLEELERKCLVRRDDGGYVLLSRALAHFVKKHVGTSLAAAVAEGERQMVTVLYADVVGFTPMTGRHRPEEILTIIKPAVRMFVDVVDRHGGKVANFGGDSVMALFGVPTEQPDDAVRAVRAALEIQAEVAAYACELKQSKGIDFSVKVGLDTGVVVLGEIGGEQRAEYTALGDAVNLAQRLEAQAQPGTVVISNHTYQQVRGRFRTESLSPIKVKGKSRPVKAYRVLGERTNER